MVGGCARSLRSHPSVSLRLPPPLRCAGVVLARFIPPQRSPGEVPEGRRGRRVQRRCGVGGRARSLRSHPSGAFAPPPLRFAGEDLACATPPQRSAGEVPGGRRGRRVQRRCVVTGCARSLRSHPSVSLRLPPPLRFAGEDLACFSPPLRFAGEDLAKSTSALRSGGGGGAMWIGLPQDRYSLVAQKWGLPCVFIGQTGWPKEGLVAGAT